MTREEIMQVKMTNQEAIEILRDTPIDLRSPREDDIHTLYAKAQMMAIEALEKQIPKKVEQEDDNSAYYYCPVCAHTFTFEPSDLYYAPDYCPDCGQLLSWESEEND